MLAPGFTRRWLTALAVAALLGLGTFGLHHIYADAFGLDDTAHDCLTCRVVGSTVAMLAAAIAAFAAPRVFAGPPSLPVGLENACHTIRAGSRAPPVAV